MLHIKEIDTICSQHIKIMFTIDATEDLTLLAQLVSPMAETIFVKPLGGNAHNVYSYIIENGKRKEIKHGFHGVFIAYLSKLIYDDPDEESGQAFFQDVHVDIIHVSKSQDVLLSDEWKKLWLNCDSDIREM